MDHVQAARRPTGGTMLRMPKLTDDEMALIAQALRSYSALIGKDAERMAPGMADSACKRSEAAAAMAERFEKARLARV